MCPGDVAVSKAVGALSSWSLYSCGGEATYLVMILIKKIKPLGPWVWFPVTHWLDISSTCKIIPFAVGSYLSLEQGSQTCWSREPHYAIKNYWGSQRASVFMDVSVDIFQVKNQNRRFWKHKNAQSTWYKSLERWHHLLPCSLRKRHVHERMRAKRRKHAVGLTDPLGNHQDDTLRADVLVKIYLD